MELERDFKELLELLNSHQVEYILVGAYALAFHGAPRFTGDLDIFVKPDSENSKRIMAALSDFGFGSVGLTAADFQMPDQVRSWASPRPGRSHHGNQRRIVGAGGCISAILDNVSVRFISRQELIANKRAAGRKKDLADLEALGES
jgi:hypothetical protein